MNHDIKDVTESDFFSVLGEKDNISNSFGLNIKGVLKPFTTKSEIIDYPSYQSPSVTGYDYGQANSAGLNPYGKNSIGEGIIWGTGVQDFNTSIPESASVRGLGLKSPQTVVGWGYDTFGYPAPNNTELWESQGPQGTASPGTTFINAIPSGTDVSFYDFLAGPLDLRWDNFRKVWCGHHGGVQAGRITQVSIEGGSYDPTGYYFAEDIRYDVEMADGLANKITLTDLIQVGPKPPEGLYKVKPVPSGDFCFLVNYTSGNLPMLSVWVNELPEVGECPPEESVPESITTSGYTGSFQISDTALTFENGLLISVASGLT